MTIASIPVSTGFPFSDAPEDRVQTAYPPRFRAALMHSMLLPLLASRNPDHVPATTTSSLYTGPGCDTSYSGAKSSALRAVAGGESALVIGFGCNFAL